MNKIQKQSKDIYTEKIEQLKSIYPALFSDEGNLNEDELRNFLDRFSSTSEGKYEFNWAGKMSAKRNAFTTSKGMLKPDKKRSIDFDNTENLILEGDNLEVLKLLQKAYQSKIKCIYIDPPYNTGNDFIYTDNFIEDKQSYWEKSGTTKDGIKLDSNTESQGRYHSNWLNMMYPRLLLARNLLTDDGVIFISIDDNEVHNLRKVMDEIFGEENVDCFVWRKSGDGRDGKMKNTDTFRKDHEYILIGFKNVNKLNKIIEKPNFVNKYENLDNDPRGPYKAGSISKKEEASNPLHPFYYEVVSPSGRSFKRQFEIPKEEFELLNNDKRIYWGKAGDSVPALKIFVNEARAITPYSILLSKGTTTEGKKELRTIFNIDDKRDFFDNPKPVLLIKTLVQLSTNPNSLILDFFAGSGTTAQSVMELNKEDGGNRKYILVQIPEKTDENSEAYKEGYKKISDICIERVKRVSEKLKKDNIKGDLGFKVLTLSPSYFPENLFVPDSDKTSEENKKALVKYMEDASTQLEFEFDDFDLLYEVLLKDGFNLNFKIEKLSDFTKNDIYKVKDDEKEAYISLDTVLEDQTLQKLQEYSEKRFICLERAVDTTKKWNLQNIFGSNLWVI